MGALVIPFPVRRREQEAGTAGDGTVPGEAAAEERPFALLSLDLRRVARSSRTLAWAIAARVQSRCLQALLDTVAGPGVGIELGGTAAHPVIEARIEGPEAAARAARAALEAQEAVRGVQRVGENEFRVSGAVATGTAAPMGHGVTVISGAPETVATRLRELAAPGQILLTAAAWVACGDEVDVYPAGSLTVASGAAPVPFYSLRALR